MTKKLSFALILILLLVGVYLLLSQLNFVNFGSEEMRLTSKENVVADSSGFPEYPGAQQAESAEEEGVWYTNDAVLQVTAWYMSNLRDQGWNIETTLDVLKNDVQEVMVSKDDNRYMLSVISTDTGTEIKLAPIQ